MSVIQIYRKDSWHGAFAKYKVICNGRFITKISNAQSISFDVEPGEYYVFIKTGWHRSNKLKMEIECDETQKLLCESNLSEPTMDVFFRNLFFSIFLPHRYLRLQYESS